MGEIVTESAYTRRYLQSMTFFLSAYISLTTAFALTYVIDTNGWEMGSPLIMLSGAIYLFSVWRATSERGYWYRFWGYFTDSITWTLDDIDTEEFADGPIELEQ